MAPRGDVQLAIGYWLVSHKETLRKWWAISLLVFIGLTFLWGGLFSLVFFTQSGSLDRQVTQAGQGISQLSSVIRQGPKKITASDVAVLARDETHVDLYSLLSNPNNDWGAATVTVHFSIGGNRQPAQTIFLNPASEQPVLALNVAVTSAKTTADITIDDTNWAKAATAALPEPSFVTDSLTLTPTTVTVNGQAISTISVRASVTNRSVYNFRHALVPIVIRNGQAVVAVDLITTDAWPTLTSKTITSVWSYPLSGQLTAEIRPQVSRFDLNNVYR